MAPISRRLFLLSAPFLPSALTALSQDRELPPVSWSCPMHPDVIQDKKGKCPVCGMDLVAVRLDYVWSCPVHSVVEETHAGKCPICRRDLVQVTVALSFACPDNPKLQRLSPGSCADGTPTVAQHTPRAHGNHSPQHGGSFFMAPDNWHHLEGTVPEAGLFRLYLYDDYSKPLPPDQIKKVSAVAVNRSQSFPLKVVAGSAWLDAHIDTLAIPAELTAKVRFQPDAPEYRFDFVFQAFSKDADGGGPLLPNQFQAIDIPDKTSEIIALLNQKNRNIRSLIDKGAFGEIYVDAFQAKDLALALDLRVSEVPLLQRSTVKAAIEELVRSAWQLDSYGDLGDRKLIDGAFASFTKAVQQIVLPFSVKRP
jgi:hypothetical protein